MGGGRVKFGAKEIHPPDWFTIIQSPLRVDNKCIHSSSKVTSISKIF